MGTFFKWVAFLTGAYFHGGGGGCGRGRFPWGCIPWWVFFMGVGLFAFQECFTWPFFIYSGRGPPFTIGGFFMGEQQHMT
jgi:hypothetical protein